MKDRTHSPAPPADRAETVRQSIIRALQKGTHSAKGISGSVGISEKDVYTHLLHIQKSAHSKPYTLIIEPARCRKCGFTFTKRGKLRKPGKCPLCRSETIDDPLFWIE